MVVLDPSLLHLVRVTDGLVPGGTLEVRSSRDPDALRTQLGTDAGLAVVDANRLAHEETGSVITHSRSKQSFPP